MTKDIVDLEPSYVEFKGFDGINYALKFAHDGDAKAKYELKDGFHSIIGTDSGRGSSNNLKFGMGETDVWLTGKNAWDNVKIEGKDGDHHVLVDEVGEKGVEIKLGNGSSAVILGTHENDTKSKVSGGDGDFSIRANGLNEIRLGHGSHILDLGLVSKLQIGDGNSQISFASAVSRDSQIVTAGLGNHLVIGEAHSKEAKTTVSVGDSDGAGEGSIIDLSASYAEASVLAGEGNHLVHVEEAEKLVLKVGGKEDGGDKPMDGMGDQTVVVDQIGSEALVQFGHGDHQISLGTQRDDKLSQLVAGDGNSRIKMDGGKSIALGNGNHVIDAGEVREISVGSGNSKVFFDTGRLKGDAQIVAGDGDHSILGSSTGSRSDVTIEAGGGNSSIQLVGNHAFTDAKIKAGMGNHTVLVERVEGIKIEFQNGDQTVKVERVDDKKTEVKLAHGDHRVELGTDAKDTEATVTAGDGNSRIFLDGGHKVHLGDGNHVVRTGDVREIKTGAGSQQIYFENGAIGETTNVSTVDQGADLVVGMRTNSKATAKIETHLDDDTIVLLGGKWNKAEIDGGDGYDVLYIDEQSYYDGDLKLKNIEEVAFVSPSASWAEIQASVDTAALGSFEGFFDDPIMIAQIQAVSIEVAINDVPELQSFELVPTPDPEGPGAAVDLIYDDAPSTDIGSGSREDRLMESSATFFLRVESYELTYQATYAGEFGGEIGYNEFGDLAGTNASDVMTDTFGSTSIFAMAGDDLIEGLDGDDAIYGGDGNDNVRGGEGQDLLDGGRGIDILNGGAGIDIFIFRKGDGTTEIEDFELSYDILDVEGFDGLTYENLTDAGRQIGTDVYYYVDDDTLILRDVDLSSMLEIDLCIK